MFMNTIRHTHYYVLAALLILLGAIAPGLYNRYKIERSNTAVELCVDWDEIQDSCSRQGYSPDAYLAQIRMMGISSIGVHEETVLSAQQNGLFILIRPYEGQRIHHMLGRVPAPQKNAGVVLCPLPETADMLEALLTVRYGLTVKRMPA